MRHIHTSIVSRHQATRGNNQILRTPPPHICSSEEILPRLTLSQLKQINHPSSNHTYTKSTTYHIHLHYTPSVTLTYTTHIISSITRTTLSPLDLWIDPAGVTALLARWTEKLSGRPHREDWTLPTSKGHGSG